MAEAVVASPNARSKGLLARAIGVIVSPTETYADVVAQPRILAALALILVLMVGVSTAFSSSQLGKELTLEQTVRYMEGVGMQVTDEIYGRMEDGIMDQRWYVGAIGAAVFIPLMAAVLAGIILGVYTALLGGDATFKQVFAIVVYSGFIVVLHTLFAYPMMFMKESMASPTSLAVFAPFLDETSFVARLLGAIDLFRLWWIVNLAIGVGVLYKRRTSTIVSTMLAVYAVIALIIAGIGTAFSGA
jgi:hypothetical protein